MTFAVEEDFPHIITIAGESGSGKTTMMMLLLGFYEPSIGSVLFEGSDIWKLDKAETIKFRRYVQAVFQDPFAVYNCPKAPIRAISSGRCSENSSVSAITILTSE